MDQKSPGTRSRRSLLRAAIGLGLALPVAGAAVRLRPRGAATPVEDVRVTATGTPPPVAQAEVIAAPPASTTPAPAASPAAPSPTPSPEPTPRPTEEPSPAGAVEFRPPQVGVGETTLLVVRAPERRGQVRFLEKTVPLHQQGDLLWAVLGASTYAELGATTAEITLQDPDGRTTRRIRAATAVVAVERPVDYLQVTEAVQSLLTPEAGVTEEQLRAKEFAVFDVAARWDRPFIPPASGPVSTQFGSGRSVNGGPVGGFHTGADIANDEGTPVVAPAPARVSHVEQHPIRGLSVILDHGVGVKSGYHHLQAALVRPDDVVEVGALIGRMGTTGYSTGPHLHWEVTVYGVNVDPFTWTKQAFRP